jgi:hypothetical protein
LGLQRKNRSRDHYQSNHRQAHAASIPNTSGAEQKPATPASRAASNPL